MSKPPERAERVASPVKRAVQAALRRTGYQLTKLPKPDARLVAASFDDDRTLPPGAADELRPDNPRLLELRARYAVVDLPMAVHTMWGSDYLADELNLRYFRGDNAYVWQLRNVGVDARTKYYLFLRDLADRDRRDLLHVLHEDGSFGCWTFEYDGWPLVSRDLLDSINELYFLDEHLGIFEQHGLTILDIGAGYGRLAHRASTALPGLGRYLCTDAVPESTFLCEYYLRLRGCDDRASVVPLDELDARLASEHVDLAVNIHSFSEMGIDAITGWLERVARARTPWLLIVPNEPDGLYSLETDRTRVDCGPLLGRLGYELAVRAPVMRDPTVRELTGVNDHFLLYRRAEH